MEQYVTFHKIIDYIKSYQQSSARMRTFGFGDIVYFSTTTSGTTQYPLLFVTPQVITYDENITTYNVSILFGDIVNSDMTNEIDVVSDMSLEAKRFISQIKRGFLMDDIDCNLPATAQPFLERFNDHIGGVALDLNIVVFEDINACDFYPTPTATETPTPTPTITPTNLGPCPQRIVISNSTLPAIVPNGNWDLLNLTTGTTTTQYGYSTSSPTNVYLETAPDSYNYATYGFVSGTTHFQFVYNITNSSWVVLRSNYDWIPEGGTYIGSSANSNSVVNYDGIIGYPVKGSYGNVFLGEYTLSYPEDCPTPTPSYTPTYTPTPSSTQP